MTTIRHGSRVGLLILIGALCFTACKKNTPVTTSPPPPVAAPPPPSPTITLRANPGTIERGQSVTLQWEATNAASVRIEPGIGDISGPSCNRTVSPVASVTYTATASGPGGTAVDNARVTVNVPPPPPEAPDRSRTPDPTMDELFKGNVQPIFFDYDKADIRTDQVSRLQSNAAWFKQNPSVRFTIEGHCDERGSQEYNLALGDQRATAVKQFLISQGISESRMSVISYGEERPECRDTSEDCMQRNRRAGFMRNP
jgi:peptidoglycan-associated lipoprotein